MVLTCIPSENPLLEIFYELGWTSLSVLLVGKVPCCLHVGLTNPQLMKAWAMHSPGSLQLGVTFFSSKGDAVESLLVFCKHRNKPVAF